MNICQLIDVLQKVFTIIAIVIGGFWTYFHYFRGRVYRSRLKLDVSGNVVCREEANYLIATVKLENIGLSKADIKQEGTALRIYACNIKINNTTNEDYRLDEKRIATCSIFKDHAWIESKEIIKDQLIISIPTDKKIAFFRLDLRIVVKKMSFYKKLFKRKKNKEKKKEEKGISWQSTEVIDNIKQEAK